jgi:hypothetical protein
MPQFREWGGSGAHLSFFNYSSPCILSSTLPTAKYLRRWLSFASILWLNPIWFECDALGVSCKQIQLCRHDIPDVDVPINLLISLKHQYRLSQTNFVNFWPYFEWSLPYERCWNEWVRYLLWLINKSHYPRWWINNQSRKISQQKVFIIEALSYNKLFCFC